MAPHRENQRETIQAKLNYQEKTKVCLIMDHFQHNFWKFT